MAWMVFGFVVAFSVTMTIVTEAKAQELLIGSAALVHHSPLKMCLMLIRNRYAAVLVTFLGNMNQGTGFRTG